MCYVIEFIELKINKNEQQTIFYRREFGMRGVDWLRT